MNIETWILPYLKHKFKKPEDLIQAPLVADATLVEIRERTFSVVVAQLWNSLPRGVNIKKKTIKMNFFRQAFNIIDWCFSQFTFFILNGLMRFTSYNVMTVICMFYCMYFNLDCFMDDILKATLGKPSAWERQVINVP